MCLSIVFSIDSTLSSFKDETKEVDVEIIRNYLQAIARHAASENATKLLLILFHTKPSKTKETGNKKPQKKQLAAIPKLNMNTHQGKISPAENDISWARVVRNGNKKAHVSMAKDALLTTEKSNVRSSLPARSSVGRRTH